LVHPSLPVIGDKQFTFGFLVLNVFWRGAFFGEIYWGGSLLKPQVKVFFPLFLSFPLRGRYLGNRGLHKQGFEQKATKKRQRDRKNWGTFYRRRRRCRETQFMGE